jgi:hypothetical protein
VIHKKNLGLHTLWPQKKWITYGQATKNYTNNRFCNTVPEKLERTCTQNYSRQDTRNDFKIPTKRKEVFRPTPQKMTGLCYVTPVTGYKAYTEKEEEEEVLTYIFKENKASSVKVLACNHVCCSTQRESCTSLSHLLQGNIILLRLITTADLQSRCCHSWPTRKHGIKCSDCT